MPTFFKIKDGWSLDERLGDMLRALDESRKTNRDIEFQSRLITLMEQYEIDANTVFQWIQEDLLLS